jgi:hypothetical protein
MAKLDNRYRLNLSDRLTAAFGQSLVNTARDSRYAGGVQAVADVVPRLPGAVLTEGGQAALAQTKLNKYRGEVKGQMTARGVSLIGTPFFDTIEVVAPLSFRFPNDPIVDLEFGKSIVRTEIQGGQDVVELISQRSPAIRMRGICWQNDDQYPEDQVQQIMNVFRTDAVLNVSSYLLSTVFGITQLYIEGISWPAVPGYYDSQAFEIRAMGYEPVELIIENA